MSQAPTTQARPNAPAGPKRQRVPGTPLWFPLGPWAVVVRPRSVLVCVVLIIGILATFTYGIRHGDFPLTPADVWRVLGGGGSAIEQRVVIDVRLGRALVAVLVGAALALSGALTQTVARNPLASPDILGITHGASLAAVSLITFASTGGILGDVADSVLTSVGLPIAAVCGSLVVATSVWLIAGSARHSIIRFVLIGVAASTLCTSLSTWVMAVGNLNQVAEARVWLTGSLVGRDFDEVWPTLTVVLLGAILAAYLSFPLAALALGDATATVLGHEVRKAQALQLAVAVMLSGVAVAATGPISFVAFMAPQIALRLAGTATAPLVTSMLTGAFIVSGADLLSRVILPWEFPVGIVTTMVGAPMLIYLIVSMNRRQRRR